MNVLSLSKWLVVLIATVPFVVGAPRSEKEQNDAIDYYVKPADYDNVQLSPGGSTIFYQNYLEGDRTLGTVDTITLKQIKRVTGEKSGMGVYAPEWADDSHIIYVNGQWHKYGKEAIVANRTLSDRRFIILNTNYGFFSSTPYRDGDILVYFPNSDGLHDDVARVDITDPNFAITREAINPGNIVGWDADVAGNVRIAYQQRSDGHSDLLHRWKNGDPWEPLPVPSRTSVIGFAASGDQVLLAIPCEGGRLMMQGLDLRTKELVGKPVKNPIYDVKGSVMRDSLTHDVIAMVYDADKPRFLWFDQDYAEIYRKANELMPGLYHWFLGVTKNKELLISSGSDRQPEIYWLLNRETMQTRILFRTRPWVDAAKMCPMEPVHFKSRDGEMLHGYLTKPLIKQGPVPTILLVHGGPYARDTWGFDPEVQYLASLGYAVLQVNYRGSTGFGLAYELKTFIDVHRTSVDDVADGARWLIETGVADPKHVAVMGGSYGGYVALASAARYSELYRCVVGFAGVYDWESHISARTDDYGSYYEWRKDKYADVALHPEIMRPWSPVFMADKIKCPVWLGHGGADAVVYAYQSKKMAAALRRVGGNVELHADSWGVHGFPDPEKRHAYYKSITEFLRKNLE